MGLTGDEQAQSGFGQDGANPFGGFGNFWGQQQQGGQQFSEEFFGDFENFFNMGQGGTRQAKGQDVFINMEIDFMESIKGSKKTVNFEKKGVCPTCSGTKSKPGTSPSRCSASPCSSAAGGRLRRKGNDQLPVIGPLSTRYVSHGRNRYS